MKWTLPDITKLLQVLWQSAEMGLQETPLFGRYGSNGAVNDIWPTLASSCKMCGCQIKERSPGKSPVQNRGDQWGMK